MNIRALSVFTALLLHSFTMASTALGQPLECENAAIRIRAQSALYIFVNDATQRAEFGSPYLEKAGPIRQLTVTRHCENEAGTLERISFTYQTPVRAEQGPYRDLFICKTSAERRLVKGRFTEWNLPANRKQGQPVCRVDRDRGNSSGSGSSNSTGGSGHSGGAGSPDEVSDGDTRNTTPGPDDIDDGSGSRGDSGEGSGNSPSTDF